MAGLSGLRRPVGRFGPFGAIGEYRRGAIAGVNIPTNKRVTISLRYIYGIGPTKARGNLQQVVDPRSAGQPAVGRGRAEDPRAGRPRIPRRRRPAPRSGDEHQAADGPGLLSRPASSPRPAGAWPADAHQARTRKGKATPGTRRPGTPSRSPDTARSRIIWPGISSPCSVIRPVRSWMRLMMRTGKPPNKAFQRTRCAGR